MPYNGSVTGANHGYYVYTTVGTVGTISATALTSDIDPQVYTDATFTTLSSNWACTTHSGTTADSCTAITPVTAGTNLYIEARNYAGTSGTFTFAVGAGPDTTPPTVSSTSPANTSTGIAVNAAITATFSEPMTASTVTAATFTLNNGVTGAVTYSGTTATFTPSSNLAYSTTYTATIATGVKDAAGNAMATPYTWTFTTGANPDTTPPTVLSTSPANSATGIAVNAAVTAAFSETMTTSTVSTATFTLNNGVTGAVTYSGTTATFTPSSNLAYSTTYTATIATGVEDAAGNAMVTPYTWTFTTGANPDTIPPTVLSTSPANNATGIAVNAAVTATFRETMTTSTVSTATFTLNNGVTGAVTYSGTTATFTPLSNLAYSTAYTATITTAVKDAAGNSMASNYTWTFTTQAPPPIDTGITASQCYQAGSDALVACNSAGAIALNNAQDGMVGRDANAASNSNTDGKLGFSYTNVTGGCVLDNVTGLMWEIKTNDYGLRDWGYGYTNFGAAYNPATQYQTDASGYVTAVNATNLCGYSDWRLPTVDELHSIVDYSVSYGGITIDTTWFPLSTNSTYWTATSVGASYAWYVDFFGNGISPSGTRSYAKNVRLVRAGHSPITPRYTVSADGQEVTDNQTKLIWRRCAEGMVYSGGTCTGTASTFTHQAALQRAAAQASSAGIAWRLPNVKELSSIADKSLVYPAIDSTAFPATPPLWFWSSSPLVGYSNYAWYVYFNVGYVYGYLRDDSGYVRLVRAGQ
jgi:hypothetical protein